MYEAIAYKEKHDRLGFTLFVAAVLHLVLILGLAFDARPAPASTRQLEVTLATHPSNYEPEDAQHIAQADQVGSGEQADIDKVTSTAQTSAGQPQAPAHFEPEPTDSSGQQATILSTTAANDTRVAKEDDEQYRPATELAGISPEVDRLTQELADLEADLDRQNQAYANMPRVRRLTSVSTKRAVDAAYLRDWRSRIEAVGNKYYPEASRRYGIYGDLRLLVVVRQDGSLEDIQILSSSGYAVLDEAAMKIVRLAAPFGAFPAELRASTDKLEIIRTWQFQENRLSSG